MDRVHKGGPWTWGPCFVYVRPSILLFPFAVFRLCCSTVLSGYCNVSFYFLGISGLMKLHYFA